MPLLAISMSTNTKIRTHTLTHMHTPHCRHLHLAQQPVLHVPGQRAGQPHRRRTQYVSASVWFLRVCLCVLLVCVRLCACLACESVPFGALYRLFLSRAATARSTSCASAARPPCSPSLAQSQTQRPVSASVHDCHSVEAHTSVLLPLLCWKWRLFWRSCALSVPCVLCCVQGAPAACPARRLSTSRISQTSWGSATPLLCLGVWLGLFVRLGGHVCS